MRRCGSKRRSVSGPRRRRPILAQHADTPYMTSMSVDRFTQLEQRLGYVFRDKALLRRALTHASHDHGRNRADTNERLEFLGDRVLGLLAAQALYERFADVDEGGLAPRLNAIVRREACARAARRVDLGPALRLGPSEADRGGREKDTILADACEALLAALYLDGGWPAAQEFFARFWTEELGALSERPRDPKSRLQEWAAARKFGAPVYALVTRSGPDHRPAYIMSVTVSGAAPQTVEGEGGSKQAAERAAAEALLAQVDAHG